MRCWPSFADAGVDVDALAAKLQDDGAKGVRRGLERPHEPHRPAVRGARPEPGEESDELADADCDGAARPSRLEAARAAPQPRSADVHLRDLFAGTRPRASG